MREKCLQKEVNPPYGARWRVLVAVVALTLWTSACAHTDEQEQVAREAERRELDLLRERVARLERQSSDTHAKLDRVLAKLDDRETSLGSQVAPRREPAPARPPVREVVPPDALAIASRSVDISRERIEVDDDNTSSLDDASSETNDPPRPAEDAAPIVIDAEALRRLDARDTGPAKSARRSSSSTARPQAVREQPHSDSESSRQTKHPPASLATAVEGNVTTQGRPPTTSPVTDVNSGNPKLVYKRAMKHFDDGRCDLAEQGFSTILTRAPDHDLADNALYWTGVCRQRAGRLEEARQLFADVALRYPSSNKLADALFSLAEVHEAQGDPATARMYYSELVTRFPSAEGAKEAEKALLRLGKR